MLARNSVLVLVAFLVALGGCERLQKIELPFGKLDFRQDSERDTPTPIVRQTAEIPSGATVVRLDPKKFKTEGIALWDGRPSFGGIWVASPDAKDPERVLITNTVNGKQVLGALFTREIFMEGPPIQLSSEAASALGVLAGQPIRLSVVAVADQAASTQP